MVKFRILLNRFIPLILVLVVLISIFPAVPVFAAEVAPTDAQASSGDVAAAADYTVSGVWVINSSPSITSLFTENVNFTSNGQNFYQFSVVNLTSPSTKLISYVGSSGLTDVFTSGSWVNSAYRTVNFGSSPQTVSSQFYSWLTSNATKDVKYTYTLKLDGTSVLTYTSSASTVQLNFEIFNESAFFYFGSDYDNGYDKGYSNDVTQRFAGISKYNSGTQLEYAPGVDGATYTIDVFSSSRTLNLYSVYEYPLYIDPNGGTWNGSSNISVFWDLPTMDTDEIYDPVRAGYVFSGWSFSGGGEFNDAGDPPYNYEHGTSPGYLTANWVAEEVPSYTHTISIDGSSYSFTADYASPSVQIQVLPAGISMTSGNTTKTWTYSGSDVFVGIQDSSGNIYDVDSSFSLVGSFGSDVTSVLTSLTDVPIYTHTISIDGSSYTFTTENKAPPVTIEVTSSGITMSYGDSTHTWTYSGSDTFVGIKDSSGNTYDVGAYFSLLGSLGSSGYDVTSVLTPLTDVPIYTHTITIDGSSYTFTSENKAPPVTIEVTSSGITMSFGDSTYTWTYSGADNFVGIKDSSGNICDVGSSCSILGLSGSDKTSVLTPLTETPSQDIYTTLVKLYDSSGNSLLKSFFASSEGVSPSTTLAIGETQLVFDSSALDSPITWDYTGDGTILGIALTANATAPSYTPGQDMTFGGVPNQGFVISIYLLTDSSSAPDEDPDSGNDFVIPAGQYEAKKAIMTGEYVALPSWPADLDSVPFAFNSSGLNYQSMSLGTYLPTSQAQLQYGSTAAYRYAGIDQSAGFTQDAFALVYLASDQAVPEAFYNWFTSAFTRISDELVSPTYSVTINIWNAAGTSVLRTVTYSGTLCPVATLQVTENGCIISCPGQNSIEWSTSGEFYGFRLYKVSTNAIYTPGNFYSLPGGAAADVVVDLFYSDTVSESQVQEVFSGVSSFLVDPIMVFFNIEFIPGLSFSRIAMFAFLLGLVWWFLKVSK